MILSNGSFLCLFGGMASCPKGPKPQQVPADTASARVKSLCRKELWPSSGSGRLSSTSRRLRRELESMKKHEKTRGLCKGNRWRTMNIGSNRLYSTRIHPANWSRQSNGHGQVAFSSSSCSCSLPMQIFSGSERSELVELASSALEKAYIASKPSGLKGF